MPRTKSESTVLSFQCSLVNKHVQIFRDYNIIIGGDGEEAGRYITGTTCSDMNNCDIATHGGSSASYDWSKCVFIKESK